MSYFDYANQLCDGGRQSIIETLDLGNNKLQKEVERLGSIAPFNKYDPASKNEGFDRLDID
jgi:hypothetical protein